MARRPVVPALATGLALLVGAVACGSSSAGPTGPAASPAPRIGAVTVNPASGPIGTLFTLAAQGLKEGDAVAFEITFPGEGMAFPGAALTVLADGSAFTTYRATTANQPGSYMVRLTGAPGVLAEGRFTVTDGPAVTSTFPETTGPSTTARTGTTSRSGRTTTTVKGATTTTSPRGASTTSTTTKKATTPSSTVTTKPGTVTTSRP